MSLLSDAMEEFAMYNKTTTFDSYGGRIDTYTEGATFQAAAVLDTSMQARIAEKQGVTGLYTITTAKAVNLQFHDVIKRMSDGKVFRIKSDGDDKKTPISASLDMRQVSAEKYTITG